jgi:hypothetical protein
MAKLFNLARMTTATTLTGTITLGSAVSGFLSFSGAGVSDGDVVFYGIADGANSEVGYGTYTAAGTTLTRNVVKSTNSNSAISLSGSAEVFITALAESFGHNDCGKLAYVSATQVKFSPFNGNKIKINGLWYEVPSAGVSANNTSVYVNGVAASNLAASTLYYVYIFSNSGTLTIDFSTTAHTTSTTAGNVGNEIKSGDDTRSLVGMVYTNGSSQFDDSTTKRNVCSWPNRYARGGQNAFTAIRTTASGTWAELNSEIRIEFVAWSNDVVHSSINGVCWYNSSSFAYVDTAVGFDGTTPEQKSYSWCNNAATLPAISNNNTKVGLSEGHHYATVLGQVSNTGASGEWGDTGRFDSLNILVMPG